MLSSKTRKKLIVVLSILIFANLLLFLAPDASKAKDREILRQADLLIKQQKYGEAIQLMKRTLDFRTEGDLEPFEEKLKFAQAMEASETAFLKGMECYNQGDYETALQYFRQVSPKDVNNFTGARERICELDLQVVKDVINEKEQEAESGS